MTTAPKRRSIVLWEREDKIDLSGTEEGDCGRDAHGTSPRCGDLAVEGNDFYNKIRQLLP